MANTALSDAIYSRLSRHFVRRLRHAQARAAIIAAVDQDVLAAAAFSGRGKDWTALYPGLAAARLAEAEITRLIGFSSGHPLLLGARREFLTSELIGSSLRLDCARTKSRWYHLGVRDDQIISVV